MSDEDKKEIERLKCGVRAIVASLVNKEYASAMVLARTTMYGGSVTNALDVYNLGMRRKPGV